MKYSNNIIIIVNSKAVIKLQANGIIKKCRYTPRYMKYCNGFNTNDKENVKSVVNRLHREKYCDLLAATLVAAL